MPYIIRFFIVLNIFSSAYHACADSFDNLSWHEFEQQIKKGLEEDRKEGLSYIIGGGLTLAGGIAGSFQTTESSESIAYALLQSIGVTSIGYGIFKRNIGDERLHIYYALKESSLSLSARQDFLNNYRMQVKNVKSRERQMRGIVHGLLATVNALAATREKNSSVQNGLYFISGVNALAALSFSFEF